MNSISGSNLTRRHFLHSSVGLGLGACFASSQIFGAAHNVLGANGKLNIALIGVNRRGAANTTWAKEENIVAICDVNELFLAEAAQNFPKARKYTDWRKCLEQKNLDAVVVSTTDFTHAHICLWAMNRDLHIYCEKPLTLSVEEARLVRAKYLSKKNKLATQVGTQRHSLPNFARVRENIRDGIIGEVRDVHAWGNRVRPRDGYPTGGGTPPATFNYDLWTGPTHPHPFHPDYMAGCAHWNMYWNFGNGQVGDMGSHTMDLAWNALDADFVVSAEAEGEPFNPDVTPVQLRSTFMLPENDWRGPVRLNWHQGGLMPSNSPLAWIDLNKIEHGVLFKGTRGFIIADFENRVILPYGKETDLTYFTPRPENEIAPPIDNHGLNWVRGCKGNLKTSCDFEYGSRMVEAMCLGLVAYRARTKIKYDGATGSTDNAEANQYLKREYREGWPIDA